MSNQYYIVFNILVKRNKNVTDLADGNAADTVLQVWTHSLYLFMLNINSNVNTLN